MKNEPITVTDALGRKITLQYPDFLTRTRGAKILDGKGDNYTSLVVPCFFVRDIDGRKFTLKNEAQLETLIEVLGDEGSEAITEAVLTQFPNVRKQEE